MTQDEANANVNAISRNSYRLTSGCAQAKAKAVEIGEEDVRRIALRYPVQLQANQIADVERIAFHMTLLPVSAQTVCDIGGGIGLFSLAVVASGREATLIDDFKDAVNRTVGEDVLGLHRASGVDVISRDVVSCGIPENLGKFDAITLFETIEHWHDSPRAVLHQAMEHLRPNGTLVISVPNCVDVAKRLLTVLGRSSWSGFDDWYYESKFRGHVRETHPQDLQRLARDLGLVNVRVFGRNWDLRQRLGRLVDGLVRTRFSWCSTLYIVAQRV